MIDNKRPKHSTSAFRVNNKNGGRIVISNKILKANVILLIGILLLTAFTFITNIKAAENTTTDSYYVSTAGNDTTGSGSISSPFRTIQKAANMVSAGDTVYIMGGTYYEEVIIGNKNGAEKQWINFMPYNNEEVVVDGRNIKTSYYSAIFYIHDSSYIRVTGLKLLNSAYGGIHIQNNGTNHIWIDHNIIRNCSARGIATFSEGFTLENITIEYNTVDFVNNNWKGVGGDSGEAISVSQTNNFNICYNHVSRSGKICIDTKAGSSYGTIHHNQIDTSSVPGGFNEDFNHIGIYIEPASQKSHDISIYNNLVYGDHGGGIWICPEETGGSAENINVYNNIINLTWMYGNGMGCFDNNHQSAIFKHIYFYSNTVYTTGLPFKITGNKNLFIDVQVENNIFTTKNESVVIYCTQINYSDNAITLSNNIFYNYGGNTLSKWDKAESNITGFGTNAIIKDPQYVKRTNPCDFYLNNTSPAIENGVATLTSSVDYNGNKRPQGNKYDIGAYEYLIEGEIPVAKIKTPMNISTYQPVQFDGSESYDKDGDIVLYSWDFGDGTTSTQQNPTHTYSSQGTYIVTLTVTDNDGTISSKTATVTVATGFEKIVEKKQDAITGASYSGAVLVTLLTIVIALGIIFKKKVKK